MILNGKQLCCIYEKAFLWAFVPQKKSVERFYAEPQQTFTCLKLMKTPEKDVNMFKIDNKGTTTTSLTMMYSCASTVNFGHIPHLFLVLIIEIEQVKYLL